MSSKLRLVLAGLTAAALIGGVMVADPADAGKKKKKRAKAKSSKVVQVSKGGKAKGGHGGNGGNGGNSGMVNNTGNVNGGFVLVPAPGPGLRVCAEAALDDLLGLTPPATAADRVADRLLAAGCVATRAAVPAGLGGCITSASNTGDGPGLTQAELDDCIAEAIPADAPVMVLVPAGGGGVFSGNGGNGAAGGTGGVATGGAGGNNVNSNTVTVASDDHSINAG